MYKAIVVDDEPRVRKGLLALIPRLDPEWVVIGEAKNGIEAVELVRREMPDLVITDIRMPLMNGLDLLSALKEYPVEVVILSGYGYFEYAQTAIKFGAFDFLLKPLKPSDIDGLLKRLKTHLQAAKPALSQLLLPHHTAKQWKAWLTEAEEADVLAAELQNYLPAHGTTYQIMTVEIDQFDELIKDDQWGDKQLLLFAVRNIVNEVIAERESAMFLFAGGSQLHFLLLDCDYGTEAARQLVAEVSRWVKVSISIGLSSCISDFAKLPSVYEEAREALQDKWIYGGGTVCNYSEAVQRNRTDAGYPAVIDEAIVRAVRMGEYEKASAELTAFIALIKGASLPFRLFRRYCLQLLSSVLRIVYEKKLQDGIAQARGALQDLFHRDFTADEFEAFMSEQMEAIVMAIHWQQVQKQNRTLDKAVAYMQSRYAYDISLDDVADHVGISGSYFSAYFKQETGETFIEYLTRLRLEKAKTLMMNADLRLYEIAQMVGYQDVKYFSRLFKRQYGVTPAEYRQFFFREEG